MSLFLQFCANEPADLSGRSIEELDSIIKDLNEKRKVISEERIKVYKPVRLCDTQLKEIDTELIIIKNVLTRRKEIEEVKNIISEYISSIEDFELLSEDELSIIIKNMDRTDYRKHGVPVRFHDFERICKEVIDNKKKYPKWMLTNLIRGDQYDIIPRQLFYKYEYKDEDGCYFHLWRN